MSIALAAALFFRVALLVATAYFIMGSIPLLVLKHDMPLDAQIQSQDMAAIPGFRRMHITAILINIAQLVAIVWGLISWSR